MNTLASAALFAAEKNLTEDDVRAGLIGLVFFVGLFVVTYFLWRSMNRQLKRVDAHFEAEEPSEDRRPHTKSVQERIAEEQQAALGRPRPEPTEPPQSGRSSG